MRFLLFLCLFKFLSAFTAEKEGYVGTDDASLAEKYGFEVRLVDCGRDNIKITYPEDIIFAEAILASRREESDV